MADKYLEIKQLNLPSIEKQFAEIWKNNDTFNRSIEIRNESKPFVFYEGPPSANGQPGIHHVISRTIKDLFCRYKTMQGFQVKRKAGWDTHGLPVELGVEKELGITKEDIGVKISVEEYNKKCREAVLRFKDRWDSITEKMGYWVDLSDPYITYDNKYIETLWWCLSELFKKDLLYKSVSIQPYSPAAGTGLSSHELNQPGTYKNVKDTTVVAMFKALANDIFIVKDQPVYFLAWTTTPWTLPSNLGLTVGPNIEYSLVKTVNQYTKEIVHVIIANALISKFLKEENKDLDFNNIAEDAKSFPWTIIQSFKGSELEGLRYEQLLAYEGNSAAVSGGDPFRVVCGDFVTTEDGTGIVHTAPAFGADDYKVGVKNNLGILTMVDRQGRFVDGLGEWSGRFVKNYKDDPEYKDIDVDIAVHLKVNGRAFKVEKYEHSYPHCWRTDKPVIYYPLDAWFIRTTAKKDRMVELNKTINWKPKSTGEGRFGNWLENMVDWNLSRSRYWGTPLPIWITEDGSEKKCIGSIAELTAEIEKANQQLGLNQSIDELTQDLHRPYIDRIILVSESGKAMQREPDLIDVWFDSGAMPYAQWHYPFENQSDIDQEKAYPADFIAEGVDQTRGWFYTLHALSVLLFDKVAYKTVVSNGLVLDKNGNKMSKRLGNVIDPFETIDQYSADATRWYLVTNASPWDSIKFDVEGIKEVQRKFFGTLFNTYQFFALYANVDQFKYKEADIPLEQRPELDQWILSSLNSLILSVQKSFDDFEPTQAGRAIENFVDEHLSNWFVRLSRRRYWKGEYELDKISAYQTLYQCLDTLSKLIAPIAPFFADWLFTALNNTSQKYSCSSVHLADFPKADDQAINVDLERRMGLAQDISSLVLSLRKKVNIKVRQPLSKILVPVISEQQRNDIESVANIILSEVNIKTIEFLDAHNNFIEKKVKPDFKVLGSKLGPKMKEAAARISNFSDEELKHLLDNQSIEIVLSGEPTTINITDVEVLTKDIPGWSIATKDNLTVALDITITPELLDEGNAREFVNRIQKIRKDNNFDLTDKIDTIIQIKFNFDSDYTSYFKNYYNYILNEIQGNFLSLINIKENKPITFINENFKDIFDEEKYILNIKNLNNPIDIEVNEQTLSVHIMKSNI